MNITSSGSSSYVAGASSNKGFSGLASGIDTESMVEAMLSGTQSKIDKQNGLKQQLEWKQEIYRDIINQINAFQSKFFGTSSTTGLLNQSFYNSMKALCSSGAFGVTANVRLLPDPPSSRSASLPPIPALLPARASAAS